MDHLILRCVSVIRSVTHYSSGIAGYDRVRRNLSVDDAPSTNDAIVAEFRARKQDRILANPAMVAYSHFAQNEVRRIWFPARVAKIVVIAHHANVRGEDDVVAYGDAAPGIYEDVVAKMDTYAQTNELAAVYTVSRQKIQAPFGLAPSFEDTAAANLL
jgi:hypothetical protein